MNAMNVSVIVARMIEEVRRRGDTALCEYARRFDKVRLRPRDIRVSAQEIARARRQVSPGFLKAIRECARQVERFARAEKKRLVNSWMVRQGSARAGQLIRPVDSAGLYIPGGRFPYPSTVLMTALPARVAGVRRIIMASPPANLTPEVLTAAATAGIDEIYRMGGAGAVAAMAHGTKTVQRVDFIVGPGNQFVTEAKRQLYGKVGIDSLAGPSEVVIIADRSTPVDFIQVDLLAQAEHDPEARAVLLTTDGKLIQDVRKGLDPRIKNRVSLEKVRSLDHAIERANEIAPEHLELLFRGAERTLSKIRHAGAIFLGPASPAAMGDYVAGPSHVLPTNGSAHFSSGLSVATFLKRSSIIGFEGRRSELTQWQSALQMAETEGMTHHARSLRLRLEAAK
jgi:histidinol dehydrogenase